MRKALLLAALAAATAALPPCRGADDRPPRAPQTLPRGAGVRGATAALPACGGDDDNAPVVTKTVTQPEQPPASGRKQDKSSLPTGTVVKGLDVPWELVFLPGGGALVTERPGTVRRLDRNLKPKPEPVARIMVRAEGEGGLLGMALDPRFKRNHLLYLYRTTASGNEVVRYRYAQGRFTDPQ